MIVHFSEQILEVMTSKIASLPCHDWDYITAFIRLTENKNVTARGPTPAIKGMIDQGLNGNIGYKLTDNMGYTFYSTFHRMWMQA